MKFTAGLVLAVIATAVVHAGNSSMQQALRTESVPNSASVDSSESDELDTTCDFKCLQVMKPVTDENGVTYPNECMKLAVNCREKKGKTFDASPLNDDAGDKSAQKKNKGYFLQNDMLNLSDGSGTSSSSSDEESLGFSCPDACPDVYDPVTDEYGNTFPSECHRKAEMCKGPKKDANTLDQ
ncbi:hypothetical protein PPTG_02598 [Phytophthora nicotianae INRA-310]|uniref:Kazal-like domain-containing protein n=1 Tax=Phytophthora nicotianae (strain INRA-310) TaxID=761204 RepID=W2RBM7_PHYN3|nr:hypothetical protein PPTG_02598 [Phytophthora nicotianae INRA-310]ETN22793.1 hypothetical protein PPTG_02598 [Phytophthora nicotianae INRA-310]